MRLRWLPGLAIVTLACAGRAPQPATVQERGQRYDPQAARIAADSARQRRIASDTAGRTLGRVTTPYPCAVAVGTTLTGRVIEDSTGRPLERARVSALPGCAVRTNAAGEYTLGPLGGGEYRITVDADTWYQRSKPFVRVGYAAGASAKNIAVRDIRLSPMHCTDVGPVSHVSGLVVDDSTGQPVEGAQVGLIHTDCGTLTPAGGRFVVAGVPPGKHTLTVRRIGYSAVEVELDLVAGQTSKVHIRMSHAGTQSTGPLLGRPRRR